MSLGPAPEALQVFSYFLKSFSGFFSKNGGKSWVLTQPLLPRQDQVFFSVIPDTHFSELVLKTSREQKLHPSCRQSTPTLN